MLQQKGKKDENEVNEIVDIKCIAVYQTVTLI